MTFWPTFSYGGRPGSLKLTMLSTVRGNWVISCAEITQAPHTISCVKYACSEAAPRPRFGISRANYSNNDCRFFGFFAQKTMLHTPPPGRSSIVMASGGQ